MTGWAKLRAKGIIMISAFCFLGMLLISFPLGAAEKTVLKPTARDKCPVCGTFVAKFPDWTTALRYKDGSYAFFDGVKDMFKYLLDSKRYDAAHKREDIASFMVKEYYGLSWIDAQTAWYVLGSDVFGPMGRELIPLRTEADAKEFMRDHKGKRIIRFSDVTTEVIRSID